MKGIRAGVIVMSIVLLVTDMLPLSEIDVLLIAKEALVLVAAEPPPGIDALVILNLYIAMELSLPVTVIVADCDVPDTRPLKPAYVNVAFASDKVTFTLTKEEIPSPTIKVDNPLGVVTLTPLVNTLSVF